ncbi:protein YLS9-like [Tripterygium wilfordii]|uniref:Protein YLS9-like n=1 Tax=Tripterygium wilfordii TaxID=458696 RepID=A0A7J7C4G0_TRIWF|nr:NDR1/HIN1-like protein 26 [Tripterygium wilfordii]KAF5729011.1 protein YLS9-like [Tripterygium wilfordii]
MNQRIDQFITKCAAIPLHFLAKKMQNPDRLPVYHSQEKPRPVQRRHTAHYYAHRVRESLTTRVSKVICSIFLSLVLIVGIVIFILWLSLRPHRPRFHIHEFSVPGLGQSTGFKNATITFNVTIRNPNKDMGIYYDSMKGSVYYKDRMIGSTPLLHPFYQKPKNTVIVYKEMSGGNLTVNSHRGNDRGQGSVVFRLDITSTIRFKVSTWHSKRHRLHANCDLEVGPDGNILPTSKDKRCPVYFT